MYRIDHNNKKKITFCISCPNPTMLGALRGLGARGPGAEGSGCWCFGKQRCPGDGCMEASMCRLQYVRV